MLAAPHSAAKITVNIYQQPEQETLHLALLEITFAYMIEVPFWMIRVTLLDHQVLCTGVNIYASYCIHVTRIDNMFIISQKVKYHFSKSIIHRPVVLSEYSSVEDGTWQLNMLVQKKTVQSS